MSAQCPHLLAASSPLQPPRFSTPVYRDECTQCFDGDTDEDGIDVCLTCYNGGCPRLHAQAHADKLQGHGHDVVLNIRKTRKPRDIQSAKRTSGEPPFKRLAIREELPEHERYDFHTSLKCYGCGGLQIQGNEQTDAITAAVLSSASSSQKSDVKAWQEEIQSCSHSKDLIQEASKQLEQSGLAHCSQCELTNNLWLCLTCGGLSCGRQQFGGVGGNGHALAHYSATRHPVSVKLGTIEPDGSADVYCYACDEERTDPSLSAHLAHWGIHIATQTKTEKSLTELQVEQNLKFDFSMTGEDGKDLEPLFGPGLTGMANLGNSCYMASVLQTLFALPEFADRYFTKGSAHALLCSNPAPASCFECQMSKVGDGLLSGRYAVPRAGDADADATAEHYAPAGSEVLEPASASQPVPAGTHVNRPFQAGIRPSMFKALVGKDHEEFKTMRQQDAEEFFRHLVGMIQRQSRNAGASSGGGAGGGRGSGGDGEDAPLDPTRVFQFEMEERLQCTDCKGVRYKTVAEETLSLPVPFVPKTAGASAAAMEIDESAPAGTSEGKGKAPIEGENAAPPAAAAPAASMGTAGPASDAKDKEEWEPVQIEECLNLLTSSATIEYKCPKCDKNVHANKSTRFATFPDTLVVHATRFRLHNWVPQKVDVPILISSGPLSLDKYLGTGQQEGEELLPEDTSASTASAIEFNATAMAQLEGMGFPSVRAQKALLATGNTGDADAAMNWLFAHMEDADIDDPIPAAQLQVSSAAGTTGASAGAAGAPAEQIAALAEMGFTPNQARKALRETGGSADAAVEWLFSHPDDAGEAEGEASAEASSSPTGAAEPRGSRALPAEYRLKAFISHRGPSAASGHYVAHVHLPQVGWVFFNDEKVVGADGGAQAAINLIPHAYLYVFEKVQPTVAA